MMDIEHHMLHFLDNHDEQRLASPQFTGDAEFGRPAMLVLPEALIAQLGLADGQYTLVDKLSDQSRHHASETLQLNVNHGQGRAWLTLPPFAASAWVLEL